MARMSAMETVEHKITEAEEKVVKAKGRYDAAMKKLRELMAKKEALQKEELMNTFAKSSRSYEEVMAFLKEGIADADQTAEGTPARRGRRAKTKPES